METISELGSISDVSFALNASDSRDVENKESQRLSISLARDNQEKVKVIRALFGLHDKMYENDGSMSGKLGELYILHAATIASVNFQNDFVETLNKKMDAMTERKVRDSQLSELAFELQETKAVLRNV